MNIKMMEQRKKEVIIEMKTLLGDFAWNSDYDVSIFVENQLEIILIHMTLSKDYNSGKKQYIFSELPNVYFKLKFAYKTFERLCWTLLVCNVMDY